MRSLNVAPQPTVSQKPKFKNFSTNSSILFPVDENSEVSKNKSISHTLYFHP